VIIPVFNGEKYLAEAIESILAQCYSPIEIIIVDDGSTDNTPAIAKQYESIRYLSQTHGGISAALNNGITISKGNFYAFLDADDLWMPDKLTLQIKTYETILQP
jgi:glycosyltransferase involved in cell wall biosynthesis